MLIKDLPPVDVDEMGQHFTSDRYLDKQSQN